MTTHSAVANPVPLLDVGRGNGPLHDQITAAIERVCRSGQFVLGPACRELEQGLAEMLGVKHALGCASGSDALLLALMAANIGPGDEVIVPSFTFFATASAVSRLGALPVFVDIDPATFNIAPSAVAAAVTPRTRAIIPVHLFGQSAAMDVLLDLARRCKLFLIEDACQAIGAKFNGQFAGTLGDCGCLSFYPTKNLGGFGDGGMLLTNRDDLAERFTLLRAHGMAPRYYHQEIGINSRLDAIQAAVLNVKLPHLPGWSAARGERAENYHRLFREAGLAEVFSVPQTAAGCTHVWNQYTVRVPHGQRDALRSFLAAEKIGSEIYYPVPLHMQQCYRSLGYSAGSLPHTEQAAQEVLSLPIFPELRLAEQETVVRAIARYAADVGLTASSSRAA